MVSLQKFAGIQIVVFLKAGKRMGRMADRFSSKGGREDFEQREHGSRFV